MRAAAVLSIACCLLAAAAVSAQQPCRVFKTFNQAAGTGMLQDTINVPDAFPVASVRVTNMVLGHPNIASLQLALLQRPTPTAEFTSTDLKPAPDMVGAYTPATPVNGATSSAGQWVVRITDSQPGADQRLISLASWTLTLCPADGAAPAPVTASDGGPQVSVGVSQSGVSVEVSKGDGGDSKDDGDKASSRSFKAGDHAKNILGLLFPGLKDDDTAPTGVLGFIHTVSSAGTDAWDTHVGDTLKLVGDSVDLYKGYVNKKITDVISGVNTLGTGAQGVIGKKGSLFSVHDKTLLGFIGNLKDFVAAEVKDKVESVFSTASQLVSLHSSLTEDYKSTTGVLGQLVVAGLSNVGKLYLTIEGAAKTHVDNTITTKAKLLDAMLDKIIAVLSAAQSSKLTGPVVDVKLQLDIVALQALAAALDKVDEAVKGLPTPSGFVGAKIAGVGSRVSELLDLVGDGPVLGALMGKVSTARDLIKKVTPAVAKSDGGN